MRGRQLSTPTIYLINTFFKDTKIKELTEFNSSTSTLVIYDNTELRLLELI